MKSQGTLFFFVASTCCFVFFGKLGCQVKIAVGSECANFPGCAKLNMTGGCCPTPEGIQLGCCSEIWSQRRWGFWMVGGVGEGRWFSGAFFRNFSRENAWLEAKSWRFGSEDFPKFNWVIFRCTKHAFFHRDDKEMKATPLVEFVRFLFSGRRVIVALKANLEPETTILYTWLLKLDDSIVVTKFLRLGNGWKYIWNWLFWSSRKLKSTLGWFGGGSHKR